MQGPSLPWDFVWKMKILPKHILFAWRVLQNKLPKCARIVKWDNTVHQGCPICRDGEETVDHLLASCSFARSVWRRLPPSISKPTSSVSFWFWHQARNHTHVVSLETQETLFVLVSSKASAIGLYKNNFRYFLLECISFVCRSRFSKKFLSGPEDASAARMD